MISKFTWSINISTGGPLYDFTSSHASYFCHTETHTYTVHRNILVHTAQKHTYTVCFRNTLVHTAQKHVHSAQKHPCTHCTETHTYTVQRNTLVHTAQKHPCTQCTETHTYILHSTHHYLPFLFNLPAVQLLCRLGQSPKVNFW